MKSKTKWNEQDWFRKNPFLDSFTSQEIKFYNTPLYKKNGIKIVEAEISGRCDDYLNKNYRISSPKIPILTIDGKTWMSLSFMEIQSHYLPIMFATGYVGTCGLGLGYFTLRVADKPDVEKVTVFEKDPRIIKFFKESFENRNGFDKIELIQGDARRKCKGYDFDFLYVDIYQTMMPDKVIPDIKTFNENNNIAEENRDLGESPEKYGYHFWGYERVILDSLINWEIINKSEIPWIIMDYFRKWRDTPLMKEDQDKVVYHDEDEYTEKMSELYDTESDIEYCENVLSEMGYDLNQ